MILEPSRTASEIFLQALDTAPEQRPEFLVRACGDDEALRLDVETLLAAHSEAGSFMRRPAIDMAASGVGAGQALAVGARIGPYQIRALLGIGGMGEVYRASDDRLRREVALKVLPHRLRFDAERRARLEREAQVLASLNHPNIATLHGIEDANGIQALVMEYVDGDSLDQRIGRHHRAAGNVRCPRQEVWSIAAQLVDALEFAHGRGIVHRDLKPANVKVRPDGTVKVLDFGLARVFGADVNDATITAADMVLGTPAYMSPEQARGVVVDSRSDVWAFGCVLFEMLTGHPAFAGDSTAQVIAAILERPADFSALPPDTPASIRRLLERTLVKNPADRLRNIGDARLDIKEAQAATGSGDSASIQNGGISDRATGTRASAFRHSRRIWVAALVVLVTATGGAFWRQTSGERRARTTIQEVGELVDAGDFPTAFTLATEVERYVTGDLLLQSLEPQFAMRLTVRSTPPDADVYVRAYDATGDWQYLGRTPLEKVRLPRRPMRWKVEKDGFERSELATAAQADHDPGGGIIAPTLDPVGRRPADMVRVAGGASLRMLNAANLDLVNIPPFFLDRFEVTNKAFKEFVDAGGYEQRQWWAGLDLAEKGTALSWTEAMKRFIDTTGRPGPSTWELGGYATGQDDYPVTGVSWYEAMAYANFRRKALPTIYHWTNAAVSASETSTGLASSIVPLSNYAGKGPAATGRYQGMGPLGTYDMAGNVREWCLNEAQGTGQRVSLGGHWNDPQYIFNFATPLSPFDRSDVNGFRLMREIEPGDRLRNLEAPFTLPGRSYVGAKAVADDVFAAYVAQYAYQRGDVQASGVETVQTTSDWRKERVTIDTVYGGRMDVYLFVPRTGKRFQPMIYFPEVSPFFPGHSSASIEPGFRNVPLDFIIKSGRVLVQPVYQGSYERCCFGLVDLRLFSRATFDRWWDMSRTLDYLESRDDIDMKHAGFIGTSFGATFPLPYLAMEHRFRAAVLISGGLPQLELPPEIDPLNFVSRITLPVLMINGRFDYVSPKETSQQPLADRLGTPAADRRYCVFEFGHGDLPRRDVVRETLAWMDRYLGQTDPQAPRAVGLLPPCTN